MLGVAAFPSLLYTVMCFGIPESPALAAGPQRRPRRQDSKVLRLIEPDASPAEIEAEADEILAASSERVASGRFWTAHCASRSCWPF